MTGSATRIVFSPSGRRGTVDSGTTVLDAARMLGVDIDSVCGGRGICGRCQISIGSTPDLPAADDRLSERDSTEIDYRGRRPLQQGRRLACAARVCRDVVIDVPPDSQIHRQVVRKRAEVVAIPVDPVVRLYYVDVPPQDLAAAKSDVRRLVGALAEQWDLTGLEVDSAVLADLQPALAEGKRTVTVAVHDGVRITGVWPGFRDQSFGIAFDVGSTTIAGHLCELLSGEVLASAGTMNPQIRYGEDLMSRVSFVMMNPEDGAQQLTDAVREAIRNLIDELAHAAAIDVRDIMEITIVGNPIMHHLVLGIDPTPLGTAPFPLATDEPVRTPARDLELAIHPAAMVYLLPCIAGHVGADTAGAILSEGPHRRSPVQLLVDVGTNAEIVLGNEDALLAASSPTGPAFEGAQISGGQRAAPGAIERVRIDRNTLEPRFKVIGVEPWSDEAGFAEAAAETGVTGICGSGIIEVIGELFLSGVIAADGTIGGSERSWRVVAEGRTSAYVLHDDIRIEQNDVRAIQLAKAALHAGVRLLMDHAGLEAVDEIRLAGAFGSHIDPRYALVLGMVPDCALERVTSAGNAAGTGAMMALLSGKARTEIEAVARSVTKIETAVEPRFQEHFVGAMAIPHASAEYPHLATVVELPERTSPQRARRRRRKEEA